MFTLRPYQEEAVLAGLTNLKANRAPGILCLSTGAGKSLVIANIVQRLDGPVLILQPSKEILEQNFSKLQSYGFEGATIYSASLGSKEISNCIFATIGSIYKKPELFAHIKYILMDECHLYNPKSSDSMYNSFFKALGNPPTIGLTATPYRLVNFYHKEGYELFYTGKLMMLNRIYPFFFKNIIHKTECKELIDAGFLSPLSYFYASRDFNWDDIPLNSTGCDFKADALEKYSMSKNRIAAVLEAIMLNPDRKYFLVFCSSIRQAMAILEILIEQKINCNIVTSDTPTKERAQMLKDFKDGKIKVMLNVQVLTVGFDFPELDCIVLARPTMSLALYYQMCLDEKTEILTKRGWVGYNDISEMDRVAAADYSSNDITIKWEKPYEIIKRERFEWERMVSIKNDSVDMRVTENHDMLIYKDKWIKKEAIDVSKMKQGYKIPVSGEEKTSGIGLTFDEIKFIGWFLTDGNINKKTNAISISQSTIQPHFEEIEKMLIGCGFKYGKHLIKSKTQFKETSDRYMFTVSKGKPRGTGKELSGWGRLEKYIDKNISKHLQDISSCQFDVLLETIHLGDGSKQINQSWTRRSYHISTANKMFADRLQSLCIRHGYRCNISCLKNNNGNDIYMIHAKKVSTRMIGGISQDDRDHLVVENISKKENVWCVKVRSGAFVARRNGKCFITGNCGRGLRIADNKKNCLVIDCAGNVSKLGRVETIKIEKEPDGFKDIVVTEVGEITGKPLFSFKASLLSQKKLF